MSMNRLDELAFRVAFAIALAARDFMKGFAEGLACIMVLAAMVLTFYGLIYPHSFAAFVRGFCHVVDGAPLHVTAEPLK